MTPAIEAPYRLNQERFRVTDRETNQIAAFQAGAAKRSGDAERRRAQLRVRATDTCRIGPDADKQAAVSLAAASPNARAGCEARTSDALPRLDERGNCAITSATVRDAGTGGHRLSGDVDVETIFELRDDLEYLEASRTQVGNEVARRRRLDRPRLTFFSTSMTLPSTSI